MTLSRALGDPAADYAILGEGNTSVRTGAVGLTIGGATAVGHTHPVEINAILCSRRPELILAGPLFPDQIIVCGGRPLLVQYVDPRDSPGDRGARAAAPSHRSARPSPEDHLPPESWADRLGGSGAEVLQVTQMATKAARILRGTLACGGPQPLTEEAATRIEGRPDEHHRQTRLGLSAG